MRSAYVRVHVFDGYHATAKCLVGDQGAGGLYLGKLRHLFVLHPAGAAAATGRPGGRDRSG
jgi:hypothetical protein